MKYLDLRYEGNIKKKPNNTRLPLERFYDKTPTYIYISRDTTFTQQGGDQYSHTSLIDGFYIKNPLNHSAHIDTTSPLNSNHFPVHLKVPNNTLITRQPHQPQKSPIRHLNLLRPENIVNFQTQYMESNAHTIQSFTYILQPKLTHRDQFQCA